MRRPLYGWLAADAVALTGTRVSMIALPLFVLSTTGSATRTGLVALAEMLPLVLLKVLGGPVIDRVGARGVAVGCDLASVVVVGAIPLLHMAGHLSFPGLLALVAVAGALRGPGDAAKDSLTPSLARLADVPLERATGLNSTVERTAGMLGAAVGGALVAAVGPADALLLNAGAFGVSALLLAWAVPPPVVEEVAQQPSRDPYLARLGEGWRFLRGDRVLLGITVMVALTNLIDLAYSAVLVPVWSVDSGHGAAGVGALFACSAGAGAVGSVVAAAWAARLPRYATYLVCFVAAGAPRYVALALDAPLAGVLVVVVVGGFAAGFINPILGAVMYERIPEHLVGRVGSLSTAAAFALLPFGGLVGGFLVDGVGLALALFTCGAAYLVVTTLPTLDRRWRELDQRPVREPTAV